MHLLERMLAFDPGRRCSAEEALTHEYFADLQLPAPDEPGNKQQRQPTKHSSLIYIVTAIKTVISCQNTTWLMAGFHMTQKGLPVPCQAQGQRHDTVVFNCLTSASKFHDVHQVILGGL